MKSNQFPKQDKTPISITERANFIFKNMEKKMPKLFEYIMNMKPEK